MRPANRLSDRIKASAAWAGLVAPAVTWLAFQQGMGELVYIACEAGGPPAGPALGLLCAAICLLAGWASWRRRIEAVTMAQRFLCRVGAGASLLFALGVLLITAATLVIPPCAR